MLDLTGLTISYAWINADGNQVGSTNELGKPVVEAGLVVSVNATVTDSYGYSVSFTYDLTEFHEARNRS